MINQIQIKNLIKMIKNKFNKRLMNNKKINKSNIFIRFVFSLCY